jgi:hypothetical protein
MRRLWLFILLPAVTLAGCFNNNGTDSFLKIEELNDVYGVNDVIVFKLHNFSSLKAYYNIGDQYKTNRGWCWGPPDIEANHIGKHWPPKNVINPQEIKMITWPTQTTPPLYKPVAGKHRLIVNFALDSNNTYLKLLTPGVYHENPKWAEGYSKGFKIK